jgi:hypothetical protein
MREGTSRKNIGFLVAATGGCSRQEFADQVDVSEAVQGWCLSQQIDACVWTALRSNFRDELNYEFSLDAAVAYLKRLGKSTREKGLRYIRNTPTEVDTPLRRRVSQEWPSPASGCTRRPPELTHGSRG